MRVCSVQKRVRSGCVQVCVCVCIHRSRRDKEKKGAFAWRCVWVRTARRGSIGRQVSALKRVVTVLVTRDVCAPKEVKR